MRPHGDIKCVRSDQGTEFTSAVFESLLIKNKIQHQKSAPYSPHQNGTIERSWRTIFEMARCLLKQASLPKHMWPYAVMCSTYIRNRCYNHRIECTPFEIFTGSKPDISNMHAFESLCYAYIQNPEKLENRGEKGIFVGYERGSPAYLV